MKATITVQPDITKLDLTLVPKWVHCKIELVREWGQRVEPKPQEPIYQNTPETDNPPPEIGITLDHSWRSDPISNYDRTGIYLGHNLVAVMVVSAKCGEK